MKKYKNNPLFISLLLILSSIVPSLCLAKNDSSTEEKFIKSTNDFCEYVGDYQVTTEEFYRLWNAHTEEDKRKYLRSTSWFTLPCCKRGPLINYLRFNSFTDLAVLDELSKYKPDIVNDPDYYSETPLHRAAQRCPDKKKCNIIISRLIKKGANINAEDSYNQTPLHLAWKAGNIIAARTLWDQKTFFKRTRKTNMIADKEGNTPIHIAADYISKNPDDQEAYNLYQEMLAEVEATKNIYGQQTPEDIRKFYEQQQEEAIN